MNVSITEAKAKLSELVRRAEAGEEIVLTRHGKIAARLCRCRQMKTFCHASAL